MGYTDLEKPIAEGKIANALKSTAADHVVAKAENIYDTDLKGYQSEINSDFTNKFNDYLPLAGGTMTGDLTIKRNSSDSPSIILQRAETNDTFEDWRMSNVGGNFKIQNRNSGNTWVDVLSLAPSATKTLTSSYSVLPSANNTLTLGNSTYKWKDVYATNFNGALKGNADTATTATTATNIKQTVSTSNANYPLLLAPSGQTATNNSGGTYFDSGVTLNPSNNILSGAKVYESLLQWGNTAIAGSLSPLDVAMDSQWSANRLSFMPASGINIEYSTNGGTTWTDYGATDNQKRSLVTTGLSYSLSPGKNTTRQKINSDRVRVTITAENGKTYFSLKKIYMYISQNGASGCKVLIEKSQCGSDTTFVQVGEYSVYGWSGWNSIPLTANFGGGDGQTGNVRRLRFTFYFTTYATGYGETDDKSAVKWTISKLNMIGETSWSNSGGNLPTIGHIYSYDINKNVTFPANVTALTFIGSLSGTATNADTATNATNAINATYIKTGGRLTAETTTNRASGLRLYEIYSNGYPCTYGNVLQFNGANGVGQLACQWYGTGLWYRSAPDTSTAFTDWAKLLTDTNTSVEGGGSTWGSSITVNIGGTSKTLTIPANPNTNTAHNHAVGVGLICDNTTATTSGTVTYKAKLKSETASTLDSSAMGSTANRQYAVGVDKSGYLSVNIPWTDTNTDTKNTTGATNSASKMYLIGATSQDTNPQTYSNSNVYATNGDLVANSFQGSIKGTSADNVNTAYKDLHFRFYNNVTGCDSTVSTDGKRYAGTANSYGFPVSNNANAMLWLGAHSGNYGHQLGFSSDGRIYDRYISNGSFPTTVNGGSWKKIAFTSDIPTKTSSLTNDSGYLTSIETATTAEITALFN